MFSNIAIQEACIRADRMDSIRNSKYAFESYNASNSQDFKYLPLLGTH